jgi:PAN domain
MRTCPACQRTYDDETMLFCLADGARLLLETRAVDPNATWHLQTPQATQPGPQPVRPPPTEASPQTSPGRPQSTITYRPEPMGKGAGPFASPGSPVPSRRSLLPWLFAIVLVIGASGVMIAWLLTRGRSEGTQARLQTPSPAATAEVTPSAAVTPSIESSPQAKPSSKAKPDKPAATPTPQANAATTPAIPKGATGVTVTRAQPTPVAGGDAGQPTFGPLMDNITFSGTNLTYYPRSSPQLCQADCARNASCRGYTWVKPGGYNPGDSAMCYLIAVIGGRSSHKCCMSAVKH